jgi:predicted NAD/FAD-binding protein
MLDGARAAVDTGFLVYNDRTYPRLTALFAELGVATVASEMSFAARVDGAGVEWSGTSLRALFAQPRNALSPAFWRMLLDIVRFNREATTLAASDAAPAITLGDYLVRERYSRSFCDWYLLPMAAAIWSAPKRDVEGFCFRTFVRFCHNHGLLALTGRPQWRTVKGGARTYVERIAAALPDVRIATPVTRIRRSPHGVDVVARGARERFDEVVLACHSDQARTLLADASPLERALLARVRYQANRVVLHTDPALLPKTRRAWSAWNYLACDDPGGTRPVAVSYLINKLQPLPFTTPVIVTLNPPFEPARALVLQEFEYSHPVLDDAAVAAQQALSRLQGVRRTWFAGAWLGYGFHEDGLESAHAVAAGIARCGSSRASIAPPVRAAA